jgi:hypothetical protein
MIHPDDGGVLCPNCMVERASKLPHVINITGRIMFAKNFDSQQPPSSAALKAALPCPFCGVEANVIDAPHGKRVYCNHKSGCIIRGNIVYDFQLTSWNHRPHMQQERDEQLQRYKFLLETLGACAKERDEAQKEVLRLTALLNDWSNKELLGETERCQFEAARAEVERLNNLCLEKDQIITGWGRATIKAQEQNLMLIKQIATLESQLTSAHKALEGAKFFVKKAGHFDRCIFFSTRNGWETDCDCGYKEALTAIVRVLGKK